MAPALKSHTDLESVISPLRTFEHKASRGLSFQAMLDEIRRIFSRPDNRVDIDELRYVLEMYQSNKDDWSKYAYYEKFRYTRNLVDDHEKYNIMIMSWGLDTKSCIHDHSGSHCFMKMLEGELLESRYTWPDDDKSSDSESEQPKMDLISETRLKNNDVLYINDEVGLHRVVNPNANRTAASLHVYIPPIRTCQAFDEQTGQAKSCKLTFYSKHGRIIKDEQIFNC